MKSRLTWPKYRNITENAYMSYSFDAIWAVGLMLNKTANALSLRNTSTKLEDFSYTDPVLSQLFLEEFAKVKFFGASVGGYLVENYNFTINVTHTIDWSYTGYQ